MGLIVDIRHSGPGSEKVCDAIRNLYPNAQFKHHPQGMLGHIIEVDSKPGSDPMSPNDAAALADIVRSCFPNTRTFADKSPLPDNEVKINVLPALPGIFMISKSEVTVGASCHDLCRGSAVAVVGLDTQDTIRLAHRYLAAIAHRDP